MSKNRKGLSPIRAIRKKCLDCCCGSAAAVRFCTCDGVNSTRCHLWPYRFGVRPETAARKCGKRFLDPAGMPSADVSQEDCQRAMVSPVVPDRSRAPEATREATCAIPEPATGVDVPAPQERS